MTPETSSLDAIHAGEEEEIVANQAFGFWLYLMSDLVLFSAIFATYAVLGHHYAEGPTGKDIFNLRYVFVETMLLLFSSATFGIVMLKMHENKRDRVLQWMAVTFILGLGFVIMEVREFHALILEGNGPDRSAFLSSFFTLVGTHGAHVTCGLIWMATMMAQVVSKGLTVPVQSRMMRLSMFWHFLDIVWVAVFTVVYLMGVI